MRGLKFRTFFLEHVRQVSLSLCSPLHFFRSITSGQLLLRLLAPSGYVATCVLKVVLGGPIAAEHCWTFFLHSLNNKRLGWATGAVVQVFIITRPGIEPRQRA